MTSPMGPHLKGSAPPFTPTGNASMLRVASGGMSPVHAGIVVRWRADPDYLARLLAHPLEPADASGEMAMFINDTVIAGLMDDEIVVAEPSEVRFREALFLIPCSLHGERKRFHYVQYITSEHASYISHFAGIWSKLAEITLMVPSPPDPPDGLPAPGMVMKGVVSRFGDRMMTVTFRVREAIDPARVTSFASPLLGLRYFSDYSTEGRGSPDRPRHGRVRLRRQAHRERLGRRCHDRVRALREGGAPPFRAARDARELLRQRLRAPVPGLPQRPRLRAGA